MTQVSTQYMQNAVAKETKTLLYDVNNVFIHNHMTLSSFTKNGGPCFMGKVELSFHLKQIQSENNEKLILTDLWYEKFVRSLQSMSRDH